jgi:nitrous oxidase accessory protein NosD
MNQATRTFNCRRLLLTLSVLAALALAAAPAQAKRPVTVSCGQTLTHSVKLANNLTDCPGDGLVIGADNITVDLNGHTIDGVVSQTFDCEVGPQGPSGEGIKNEDGHDGLTVEGGTVQQFVDGFDAFSQTDAMTDSRLRHLTLRDNRDSGAYIGGGDGPPTSNNRIEHNLVSGNRNVCDRGFGIALANPHGNHVAHNRVEGGVLGILVCCEDTDRNVLANNSVSHNQDDGIVVGFDNDSHSVIRRNSVSHNGDAGIVVGDHDVAVQDNRVFENAFAGIVLHGGSEVSHNRLVRNGDNMIVSGNRNRVTANEITDAVGCGEEGCGYGISVEDGEGNVIADNRVARAVNDTIRVASFDPDNPTVGTVVRDNLARDAGVDGISVGTDGEATVTDTLILRNRAVSAGDDGFDVESAATTLTRNWALRNHDLGIEAVPGVTDGGGNRAAGNGNPLQCTNVFCR